MSLSYSIRAVAEETGLSAHTIRAWERRYGVLSPGRTGTNRRVYGEDDLRRLKLLHRAVASGHSIGMIAALPTEELLRLTRTEERLQERPSVASSSAEGIVHDAMQSLNSLDGARFEAALVRGTVLLGVDPLVEEIVVPLITQVGHKWERGELSIAQEHLATALIRTHLERTRLSIQASANAPRLVVTTPVGQHHELGSMLAAIVAARMDWNVTYLGPNLPAKEIADSASRLQASAVALSLVYPLWDEGVNSELRALRSLLGSDLAILAGGAAATSYEPALNEIGARTCLDLDTLREALTQTRRRAVPR